VTRPCRWITVTAKPRLHQAAPTTCRAGTRGHLQRARLCPSPPTRITGFRFDGPTSEDDSQRHCSVEAPARSASSAPPTQCRIAPIDGSHGPKPRRRLRVVAVCLATQGSALCRRTLLRSKVSPGCRVGSDSSQMGDAAARAIRHYGETGKTTLACRLLVSRRAACPPSLQECGL